MISYYPQDSQEGPLTREIIYIQNQKNEELRRSQDALRSQSVAKIESCLAENKFKQKKASMINNNIPESLKEKYNKVGKLFFNTIKDELNNEKFNVRLSYYRILSDNSRSETKNAYEYSYSSQKPKNKVKYMN